MSPESPEPIASRREQSASQMPSSESPVLVTVRVVAAKGRSEGCEAGAASASVAHNRAARNTERPMAIVRNRIEGRFEE